MLRDSSEQAYLQRNYAKCIEISTKVLALAEKNNWKDFQMKTFNSLGSCHLMIADYNQALEYYLKAYKIALEISDKELEAKILNNIALLYNQNKEYDKSIEYLQKAYKIGIHIKDSALAAHVAANIGTIFNNLGKLDSAAYYINNAIELAKDLSDKKVLYGAYTQKILNLSLMKRYDEGEQLGLQLLENFKKLGRYDAVFNEIVLMALSEISNIYYQKGDFPKAIYYARETLNNKPTLRQSAVMYELMANIYKETSPDLAMRYKDSVVYAKDSLLTINSKNYLENSRVKFELFELEKTLAENKARQKAERILFISIAVFITLFAIVLIWIFRIRSIKNRQQKIILENDQKITKLELEKEKNHKVILEQQLKEQETTALLEQERLTNERKEKLLLKRKLKEQEALALLEQERLSNENNQLAAKVLIQSNRNDLIEEIIQRLSTIPIQSEDSQLQLVIRQLKTQLKESSELDNSIAYFDQINPAFLSSLKEKYPTLSTTDIRFLSYLFLNFSTKEIAGLLNMSLDSCKKKRQRIATKMGVETSELYNYLLSI
jgi:tetratricopeptide (TPR) repeat protein